MLARAFALLAVPAALVAATYATHTLTLPGGTPAGIGMDYIAVDPATGSVWVPAGITGSVDVIDPATEKIRQVPNFPTEGSDGPRSQSASSGRAP